MRTVGVCCLFWLAAGACSSQVISTPVTYTLGGQVTGLEGVLLIANDASDPLSLSADGAFSFAGALNSGQSYHVAIVTQPAGQICTLTHGAGVVTVTPITDIAVLCSSRAAATFHVGGTVAGFTGGNLVLQNGNDRLTVTASHPFTFPSPGVTGAAYQVSVQAAPAGYICRVDNSSGTLGAADVTDVAVICTLPTYQVQGTLSGNTGPLVLANGDATLAVNADQNTFVFTGVPACGVYQVTIATAPLGLTCTIAGGSGTMGNANVINVNVTCCDSNYMIFGALTGATGPLVLTNGVITQTLPATATQFSFANMHHGDAYAIAVATPPYGQTCTLSGPQNGIVAYHDITGIGIGCVDLPIYSVSGTVVGATGDVLLQNGADPTLYTVQQGASTFSVNAFGNSDYAVTVATAPAQQYCVVTGGIGHVNDANVSGVSIACTSLSVAGSLTGNTNNLILSGVQNGIPTLLAIAGDINTFSFGGFRPNDSYAVTVYASSRGQSCDVSATGKAAPSGVFQNANITGLNVSCTPNAYALYGQVRGLASGSSVQISYNAHTAQTFTADGPFSMGPEPDGTLVNFRVNTQPSGQTCTFLPDSTLTLDAANVAGIDVLCSPNALVCPN